ncbi:MAG: hypothetical protein M1503_11520 [Thaumarchaeota archaeon]|nr:hypothetical protein [Nitrososphaerota archaeon]MCL5318872.1 hypothetical protein [Nitrososphaerota archaeon]
MADFIQKITVKSYGTIALTTSNQDQPEVPIKPYGDIVALELQVTAAITLGTGTRRASISAEALIDTLTIKDRNNKPIHTLQGYPNTDISNLYLMLTKQFGTFKGRAAGAATMADTGGSFNKKIPLYIGIDDQPCSIALTLGTIGDILSTVGTGTATATVKIIAHYAPPARNPQNGAPVKNTPRSQIFPFVGAVGDNVLDEKLPQGSKILDTAVLLTVDADLDHIQFGSSSVDEYPSVNATTLQDMDFEETFSGHQTAFYWLRHTPFRVNKLSTLNVNLVNAVTGRVYLLKDGE